MRRNCASVRFLLLSHVAVTPVCDTTTGRVAAARMSSTSAGDACARSTIMPRASMRRRTARPAAERPVFASPLAEPPAKVSKKCVIDIIRNPASNRTSRSSAPASSAWAPSMPRKPAVTPGFVAAAFQVVLEIPGRPDHRERTAGPRRRLIQAAGLMQRPLLEAPPCSRRPPLGDHERQHRVGIPAVAVDVHAARDFRDDGERLDGRVALDEARDVNVPKAPARQQIPVPQQRVGVKIGNDERAMQLGGPGRRTVGRPLNHAVQRGFRLARDHRKQDHHRSQRDGHDGDNRLRCGDSPGHHTAIRLGSPCRAR